MPLKTPPALSQRHRIQVLKFKAAHSTERDEAQPNLCGMSTLNPLPAQAGGGPRDYAAGRGVNGLERGAVQGTFGILSS